MNLRVNLFLILLLTIILSQFTTAQTISTDIKDLSKEADLIITGKVTNQNSSWNKDKTRISTLVTLTVDEVLKGDGQKTITVSHPGGEVGEIGELYTHVPKFDNDEEVLLFIKKDADGVNNKVVAGEDGKMTLYKDKTGDEKVTSQNQKLSSIKKEIKEALRQQ